MTYSERLSVPASWWLLAAGFVASLWLALAVALPVLAVYGITAVVAGLATALLLGYGGTRITVGPEGVRVGRARLEWAACGAVQPLDSDAAHRARGVDADARAYLVVRPYLPRAVRLEVDDPADPTPYWLLSTRRPDRLAAAVESSRPSD
ncbi:MAG TPA: DUF3093 domain-containing protein [Nocardioidaceae bacterium]|nr:DUF3093 domain-containing protein [Nocardioidaceae bacterium]